MSKSSKVNGDNDDKESYPKPPPQRPMQPASGGSMTIEIVSREQWAATAPLQSPMSLPALEAWLHHSVTPTSSDPKADMRAIERVGIERFGIFPYSFCVHRDGTVLEGAGLTIGAHTALRNTFGFGICWIGNYEILTPTPEQIHATVELLRDLIAKKHLIPNPQIGGHRDVKATACPGANAYVILPAIRISVASEEETMLDANDRKFIEDQLIRTSSFLATGRWNALYNPANARTEFVDNPETITLNKILIAVEGVPDIDENALAARVASLLSDALNQAILVQAIEEAVRRIFADASTPDNPTGPPAA